MNGEKFWEKTYQKNIAKMIGICYRYVADRQVAEDLAHDAFLRAIEKVDTFKGLGNFDGWLMKITVNTALSYLRTQKINVFQEELDTDFQEIADDANDESNIIQETDFSQEELLEAIHQLPEHHRTVFNLYVLENFSHEQIAKALGITVGTSKSHLARARKKLQKILLEKAKQDKKERKMLLLFLFPRKSKAMDHLYKTKFSGFSVQPMGSSPLRNVSWSSMPKPGLKIWFYVHQFPVCVGASIGIIGIFLASYGFFSDSSSSNHFVTTECTEKVRNITKIVAESSNISLDPNVEQRIVKYDAMPIAADSSKVSMLNIKKADSLQISSNINSIQSATFSEKDIVYSENPQKMDSMKKLSLIGMALLAMNNMMSAQNDETQRYTNQSDSAMIENVIVLDSNREPMQLKWETDYTLFVFLPSNVCGKPDQCCCHKMLGSRKSQVAALSMLAENRNEWQQKYNMKMFAVVNKDCSDKKESKKLEDFVKKNNLRLPLVYDFKNDLSNLAKSNREIGKRHSPLLFLVDKNGKIKYFDMEFQEGDDLRIETFLKFPNK